jgi:hypothetical protein
MQMQKRDYLVKALLDTQERVRDYMNYSEQMEEGPLRRFFKEHAEVEGKHASRLQGFIEDLK